MLRFLGKLEEILLQDPGSRGVAALACPGHLQKASRLFWQSPSVLILTGFPCCLEHTPPTENDGISGALAIARAASLLGKKVTIVTDDCNAGVVRACLKQRSFFTLPVEPKSPLSEGTQQTEVEFFAFPPASGWNRRHDRELRGLAATHDCYVAIERAGKAADGSYYTMRAKKMDHLVSPLDKLFESLAKEFGATTIGIGDGGNELGMGNVKHAVHSHISNGKTIACEVGCDALISSGVSNWGGWGLLGASWLHRTAEGNCEAAADMEEMCPILPSVSQEKELLIAQADAGARDGTTQQIGNSVDGLPQENHAKVLRDIHKLAMMIEDS